MSADDRKAETTFETILDDLQSVVDTLERGELPLEESLQVFERGIRLSREGTRRLEEAEAKVQLLLAGTDDGEGSTPRVEPLEQEES